MRRIVRRCPFCSVLILTSCSLVGGDGDETDDGGTPTEVVLVTHESFVMPDELVARFEERVGYDLVVKASGDAGALTNKLVLTKDNPTGDVVFGDRQHLRRAARSTRACSRRTTPTLPRAAPSELRPRRATTTTTLTPVDTGNVCVNVDDTWFADAGLGAADDARGPDRSRSTRTCSSPPGATTSSPGLAFLLATIAAFGDDWPTTGSDLLANGAKLDRGLVRRLPGRLHPGRRRRRPADRAVLRLLAGVHDRRRRAAPRPARCSTPASGRSSTPACWPAPTTRRAPRRWSTSCVDRAVPGGAARRDVRLPGRRRRDAAARTGPTFAVQPESSPTTVDPAEIAAQPRRVAARVERPHLRGEARDATLLALAGLALGPVLVLAVFFVLPVGGMLAQGFWPDGRLRPGRRARRARPRRAPAGSSGSRSGRRAWRRSRRVAARAAGGVRPAPARLPGPRR